MVKDIIHIDCTKEEALEAWNTWKRDNQELYRSCITRCCVCGSVEYLGIHHQDGDKRHNIVNNMSCMCFKCHMTLHNSILQVKYREKVYDELLHRWI